jgi:hypothetical protein
VVVPLKTAVGLGLNVITALPLKSAGIAVHLLSLRLVIVYIFEDVGDTVKVYGFALILFIVTGAVPSVYTTFHGAEPVKVNVRVAELPSQIAVVPLRTAVGLGFTVTTALSLKSPAMAPQLLSLTAVRV